MFLSSIQDDRLYAAYHLIVLHDLRHTGFTWMEGRGVASDASFSWMRMDGLAGAGALQPAAGELPGGA
jgi:hypothetical protein